MKLQRVSLSFTFIQLLLAGVSHAWYHQKSSQHQEWATIGTKEYQVIKFEELYNHTTTDTMPEFRLIHAEDMPEDRKFSFNIIALDSHVLTFTTCFTCHLQTEEGLKFVFKNRTLMKWEVLTSKEDMELPANITQSLVRDKAGKQYYVLTLTKALESQSLAGTRHFPALPVPYGIHFEIKPTPRVIVLIRCYAIALLIMVPMMKLVGFKDYWRLASNLT